MEGRTAEERRPPFARVNQRAVGGNRGGGLNRFLEGSRSRQKKKKGRKGDRKGRKGKREGKKAVQSVSKINDERKKGKQDAKQIDFKSGKKVRTLPSY